MTGSGFSLLEILVVIALCALLITTIFPFFTITDHILVRSELDRLYIYVKTCRAKAIADQKDVVISWDVIRLAQGVIFGTQPGLYGPPSTALVPIKDPITFGRHHMTCYPDGTCDAGTVYLTNKTKTISYALSVSVNALGYVRRYHYMSSRWQLLV